MEEENQYEKELTKLANYLETEKNLKILKKDGGKGGFGTVLFVEDTQKNAKYAVKAQYVGDSNNQKIDQAKLQSCQREAQIMRECSHKNIIELRDEYVIDLYHFIQMDLCEFSLEGWIKKNGTKHIPYANFTYYAQQIIDGVEYLHNQNYIVRDLSVRNILINKAGVVKLCDFGLAKKTQSAQYSMQFSAAGPKGVFAYFPPEVLKEGSQEVKQSKEADIWALGICLKLFGGLQIQKVMYLVSCSEFDKLIAFDSPNLDAKCNKLIQYILICDPKQRPNINQIREKMHQWFIENIDDEGNQFEEEQDFMKHPSINDDSEQSQASTNIIISSKSSKQSSQFLNSTQQDEFSNIFSNNLKSNNSNQYSNNSKQYSNNSKQYSNNSKQFSNNSKQFKSSGASSRLIDFNYLEADSLIEKYKKNLKNSPDNINYLITLGFLEACANCNFKKAEQYFQDARDIDEDDVDCMLGQSHIIILNCLKRKYKLIQNYLDKCLTIQQNYWRIHYYQSWLYFLQQKYQLSNESLQTALGLELNSPQIYSLKAVLSCIQGNNQLGLSEIEKAIQLNKDQNDPQILFRKGYIYHKILKNQKESLAAYKEALDICQKDMMTLFNITQLYNEQQNNIQAESFGQKALQLYPNSSYINYLLGSIQQSKDVAIKYYQKAVEADSGDIDSLEAIAKIYVERNLYPQAIQYYETILESDVVNVDLLIQIGYLEMEKTKRYDRAQIYYKRALEQNPNMVNAQICLGFIHKQKNEDQLAAQEFQKAIQIDPNSHRAYLELGIVNLKMKKDDEAISNFLKAYNLNKDEPIASFQLGIIYKDKKMYPQAIPYFENAIRINPKDITSLLFAANCEYEICQTSDKLIKYLKTALELNTNLPDAYRMLGDCFYQKDDRQQAEFYLRKTIEFSKIGLEKAYYQLGQIKTDQEKLDECIYFYRKCLEFNPNHFGANYFIAMAYRDKDAYQIVFSISQKHLLQILNIYLLLLTQDIVIEMVSKTFSSLKNITKEQFNLTQNIFYLTTIQEGFMKTNLMLEQLMRVTRKCQSQTQITRMQKNVKIISTRIKDTQKI
ncbi:tetratricopeptide repeat protein (macronuclear) [Tetrahymena thermophila SB210]|uniref:Tetratricopeptide repeat protein n=1 Tax=Tetrahymena thermophila (strain SB210) TaxID=312017 RepID=Q234E5_TETTS|nr:tetratricopeptide repeat protein [Tetrahymena thermophila SB210]EAR92058.1 tetratricopeptide repeat protein [Tetrahymena thermophila SB210]|eukprot:XP_001012303.1 tetratricopeptide repeat protein [Tetrahymena thermophila SB210]